MTKSHMPLPKLRQRPRNQTLHRGLSKRKFSLKNLPNVRNTTNKITLRIKHIQLSQTLRSSPVDHAHVTPSSQQAALQLSSPHTEQESLQQPLPSSPKYKEASQHPLPSSLKDKEATQQPLLSSPTPKDQEALQLSSPPIEIEAPKDKEASPVQVMPPPPSRMTNPPSSYPYDTIHKDLALYKTKTHSDPIDQFFAVMKNLKSPPGTSSAMSGLEQHVETYMRTCKIESDEEDGEVYN
jgi:hypothetical protein